MKKPSKKTLKKLGQISNSIPRDLVDNAYTEQLVAPLVLETVEKALATEEFPEDKKAELQNLYDSGTFHKKELVPNEEVIEKINKYLTDTIDAAIRSGEIPEPPVEQLPAITKKIRKNVKRRTKEMLIRKADSGEQRDGV